MGEQPPRSTGADGRAAPPVQRAWPVLITLLAVAFVVSVIHYTDNVVNFEDYPQPVSGPAPSATLIAVSWFAFTAAGVTALVLFLRGRLVAASVALAAYSISGLVGLGHYTVPGAGAMPWWRHAHIAADILCGVAVLAFAVWVARRLRHGGRSLVRPARP